MQELEARLLSLDGAVGSHLVTAVPFFVAVRLEKEPVSQQSQCGCLLPRLYELASSDIFLRKHFCPPIFLVYFCDAQDRSYGVTRLGTGRTATHVQPISYSRPGAENSAPPNSTRACQHGWIMIWRLTRDWPIPPLWSTNNLRPRSYLTYILSLAAHVKAVSQGDALIS